MMEVFEMLIHKANGSSLPLPHPRCILSWNSRNLSKQLLFDSSLSPAGGRFFLLVDLGPGAAVGAMRLEINTGYSCYLTAARHRRWRFFSSKCIEGGVHLP